MCEGNVSAWQHVDASGLSIIFERVAVLSSCVFHFTLADTAPFLRGADG